MAASYHSGALVRHSSGISIITLSERGAISLTYGHSAVRSRHFRTTRHGGGAAGPSVLPQVTGSPPPPRPGVAAGHTAEKGSGGGPLPLCTPAAGPLAGRGQE